MFFCFVDDNKEYYVNLNNIIEIIDYKNDSKESAGIIYFLGEHNYTIGREALNKLKDHLYKHANSAEILRSKTLY